MNLLAKLRHAARKHGATVESGAIGKNTIYNVEAPAGKVWAASDTHALCVYWRTDEPDYRDSAIADALERMELGLADCEDPDCDYCHPEPEGTPTLKWTPPVQLDPAKMASLCPAHGKRAGDATAAGVICNGLSLNCPCNKE